MKMIKFSDMKEGLRQAVMMLGFADEAPEDIVSQIAGAAEEEGGGGEGKEEKEGKESTGSEKSEINKVVGAIEDVMKEIEEVLKNKDLEKKEADLGNELKDEAGALKAQLETYVKKVSEFYSKNKPKEEPKAEEAAASVTEMAPAVPGMEPAPATPQTGGLA